MTPEQINREIALLCGWTHGKFYDLEIMFKDDKSACIAQGRLHLKRIEMGIDPRRGATPDYFNDLNAMHEAEKTLTPLQMELYYHLLWQTVASGTKDREADYLVVCAKSQYRAECFLTVHGKWSA